MTHFLSVSPIFSQPAGCNSRHDRWQHYTDRRNEAERGGTSITEGTPPDKNRIVDLLHGGNSYNITRR